MSEIKSKSTSSDTNAEVFPVRRGRTGVVLNYISGDDVWFAFGEDAVFEEGFKIGADLPALLLDVKTYDFEKALNMISDTGKAGTFSWHYFLGG
jgi:hypothetical protein